MMPLGHGNFVKILPLVLLAATSGCRLVGRGIDAAGESISRVWAPERWALAAEGEGLTILNAFERTAAKGNLTGRFQGAPEGWTVSFTVKTAANGRVVCDAIFPNDWNGRLQVVAGGGPGGEIPAEFVKFAADGSAVITCDGGTGQVTRRNGRVNAFAAGARSRVVREAFFKETLARALDGAKNLLARRYGREAEEIHAFGREEGGAQVLFLAAANPELFTSVTLVNPAIDFAALAAYDLHIAHQRTAAKVKGGRLTPDQFRAIVWAMKTLGRETFDPGQADELFAKAAELNPTLSAKPIHKAAWIKLFSVGSCDIAGRAIDIPQLRAEMDFANRLEAVPWRLNWLFGEYVDTDTITDDIFAAKLAEMDGYSPRLAAGTLPPLTLVLESENAKVPAELAGPLVEVAREIKRVGRHCL